MRGAVVAVVAALALPGVARAEFEGVLESRITVGAAQATGTVRTWISSAGIRSETEVSSARAEQAGVPKQQRTIILKMAEPNRSYMLDDARRTYYVHDAEPGASQDDEKYTVRRLGKATVAGHPCESVAVSTESGRESEVCVAEDLIVSEAWFRAFQERESGGRHGLFKALADAGVKGLPIRWVSRTKDGTDAFRMELVSAKREKVPASKFEIPAGYTKAETAPGMSPEMAKRMEEAMKNMSPEQRKQMEEAMKRMKGGK
ncbi:DUF4412 domain-containing protein [Anaeromyxobacter oryzae]|uniref:DUF4412 domain-containing protein n=1 Tax=Anaeromyxobacter oryzae TaxID=2918170 RepID=A0ABN6MYG9_9BACT|nr:DUF4412 domain-containing protein [Anaeromyxobacter oryzae]BDG05966.1 hypothetical protein AMOR_49620 [Anaeromyxobacter oryzae]